MDSELKKLKKLADSMRKLGVLTYKTPEIEVQLSPTALIHEADKKNAASEPGEEIPEPVQNDIERSLGLAAGASKALFWSTPGLFPEGAEQ